MLKSFSKTIGNNNYSVTALGASEGRKMLVRLVKVLGPSALDLIVMAKTGTLAGAHVNNIFAGIAERLSVEDLDYAVATFGASSQVTRPDGTTVPLTLQTQELHFAANYAEMFQWLGFCLEANYSRPLVG